MWSVFFERGDDQLMLALWESGTSGVIEENGTVRAYFSGANAEQKARQLGDRFEGGQVREEADDVPMPPLEEAEPILVGERFYITEHPVSRATAGGRLQLVLRTSSAFGTGRHETTQLCLKALERVLKPGDIVLDVGCGSGILSLGAQLLGARRAVGCDIFESTIAAAQQNVDMPAFVGSADAVTGNSADLVLANLTGAVLQHLAHDLRRVTRPGGHLIISGFLREAPPLYFQPEEALAQGDWLCWICKPERIEIPAEAIPQSGLTHALDWWL